MDAPRNGERAADRAPYGRWERLTLFRGLSLSGLVTCISVEGAADTAAVVAFTEHVLMPALKPGQIVLMDNLAPQKAPRVWELIEAAACRLLFLPPYSPDLNPIEPAWSKLKTLLRGMGVRTQAALEAALSSVIDTITTADAHGWFAHCGHAASN